MKAWFLYPDPQSTLGDWSATDGKRGTLNWWAANAAAARDALRFHESEAAARAAAEPENNLLAAVVAERDLQRGAAKELAEQLSVALEDSASARDDLRGCQRENERLMKLIAQQREAMRDAKDLLAALLP